MLCPQASPVETGEGTACGGRGALNGVGYSHEKYNCIYKE